MDTMRHRSGTLVTMLLVVMTLCLMCSANNRAVSGDSLAKIRASIRQSRFKEAEGRLREMLARNPENTAVQTLLGIVCAKQEKLEEAEQLLVSAINHDRKNAEGYEELGRLYERYGRIDEALGVYENFAAEMPESVAAEVGLARLYAARKEYERALGAASKVAETRQTKELLRVMLSAHLALGDAGRAQQILGRILQKTAADQGFAYSVADVFFENGMVGDAAQFLRLALPSKGLNAWGMTALAKLQDRQGDLSTARATIKRALKMDPTLGDAWAEDGRISGLTGEWEGAATSLRKAVELQPTNATWIRSLVAVLLERGKIDDAYPYASRLYKLRPEDVESSVAMAMVYVRGRSWGAALPVADSGLARFPEEPRLHLAKGIAKFELGEREESKKECARVLEKDASNAEAHFYLGLIAKQEADTRTAVAEFEKTLQSAPRFVAALEALGPLYLEQGETEKALEVLERASQINPQRQSTHYQLASVYSRLGNEEKAKFHLSEFQRLRKR